jgi:hypothetical protein
VSDFYSSSDTAIACARQGCPGHLVEFRAGSHLVSYFCSEYPKVVGRDGCRFRCRASDVERIYHGQLSRLDALRFCCPKCNAERGFDCQTKTGWSARTHRPRIQLALEQLDESRKHSP